MNRRILYLSEIPTPQLLEIRKVLSAGVPAKAESTPAMSQLCHKSPPKGYPKDKSEYGDSECYRYPLNTKSRALAAWRYVHQSENKSILGGKFKSVESKIRSYAKKHYNLDLQVGESEELNWEQAFLEYYDAETMGERCDLIELEPEESAEGEDKIMSENTDATAALEQRITALEGEKETLATEKAALETKASQVDALTKELDDQKKELETLRKFKTDIEEAAVRAEKIKGIKVKFEEAGIDFDEAEADSWLGMTEDTLAKIIAKMSDLKKGAKASSSIKVPPVNGSDDEPDIRKIVSDGLKELKQAKNKTSEVI